MNTTSPRRTRLVMTAAAVGIVLAVIAALVVLTTTTGDDPDTAAPPPVTPSTPAPDPGASELNTGATGFGIPDADLSGRTVMVPNNPAGQPLPQRDPAGPRTECTPDGEPVTSPEGVMIQRNFGLSTLYSETDGPSRFDGLVLAGYSRTPQGAALAAANILPRTLARGPVALEAVNKLVLDGGSLVDSEAGQEDVDGPVNTDIVALRAPMGFKILSCTGNFVVVELALIRDVDDTGQRLQQPQYYGMRLNMVWDNGTWKGREATGPGSTGPYSSLDGFTRWAL